jgi:hypothetical protein
MEDSLALTFTRLQRSVIQLVLDANQDTPELVLDQLLLLDAEAHETNERTQSAQDESEESDDGAHDGTRDGVHDGDELRRSVEMLAQVSSLHSDVLHELVQRNRGDLAASLDDILALENAIGAIDDGDHARAYAIDDDGDGLDDEQRKAAQLRELFPRCSEWHAMQLLEAHMWNVERAASHLFDHPTLLDEWRNPEREQQREIDREQQRQREQERKKERKAAKPKQRAHLKTRLAPAYTTSPVARSAATPPANPAWNKGPESARPHMRPGPSLRKSPVNVPVPAPAPAAPVARASVSGTSATVSEEIQLGLLIASFPSIDREYVIKTLQHCKGNTKAAFDHLAGILRKRSDEQAQLEASGDDAHGGSTQRDSELRSRYLRLAAVAFGNGNGALAKELSQKAKQHAEQIRSSNQNSVAAILSRQSAQVDLHGFTVVEARQHVNELLTYKQRNPECGKRKSRVF